MKAAGVVGQHDDHVLLPLGDSLLKNLFKKAAWRKRGSFLCASLSVKHRRCLSLRKTNSDEGREREGGMFFL